MERNEIDRKTKQKKTKKTKKKQEKKKKTKQNKKPPKRWDWEKIFMMRRSEKK